MSRLSLLYMISLCAVAAPEVVFMSVDRMWLAHADYRTPVADVSYAFMDGDVVDVVCVARGSELAVLSLIYFGEKSDIGNGHIDNKPTDPTNDIASGFRTTLRAAHDNAHIICRYVDNSTDFTIRLTFTLQQQSDDLLNVKIGSVPLRYQQSSLRVSDDTYEVWYNYVSNERATCDCASVSDGGSACTTEEQINSTNAIVKCTKWGSAGTRIVNIHYDSFLHNLLYDDTPLALNVTHSLFELHAYKRGQTIIYSYDKDEHLVLNCSTLPGVSERYNYYIVFNDKVERYSDNMIERIHLTAAHNNTIIACYLKNYDDVVFRQIQLYFLMKDAEENVPVVTTQKYDENQPPPTDNTLNTQTQQPTINESTGENVLVVTTQNYDENQPPPTDNTLNTQTQQPTINESTGGAGAATGHVSAMMFAGLAVLYWGREL